MKEDKVYKNRDLIGETENEFIDSITNDFIDDKFIDQLEWAMMLTQGKMKQLEFIENWPNVTMNSFDRAILMSGNEALVNEDRLKYYRNWSNMQADPEIFPNINIKCLLITDSIQLCKIKELSLAEKRNLIYKPCKYIIENSVAFYKKNTESFYGRKEGFGINPAFFQIKLGDLLNTVPIQLDEFNKELEKRGITKTEDARDLYLIKFKKFILNNFFPVPLRPGYVIDDKFRDDLEISEIYDYYAEIMRQILFFYQIALTHYYEWHIYIKEYDNIGFIAPIEPTILSEIYKTSMLKFEDRKKMLHFVREHYRRKNVDMDEDYSVFVNRYLRGENKFEYRSFYAEIIPPKYDLNRTKTKKEFIQIDK